MNHLDHFKTAINKVWSRKPGKMEWIGMEDLLIEILKSDQLTDEQKVSLCKETIDAFTGRGHFPAQF